MKDTINGVEFSSGIEISGEVKQTAVKGLWNPKYFLVLSFLFSFLPAGILYSLNYGRLGLTKKRNISLVISFIAFIALILISSVIDNRIGKAVCYSLNIAAAAYMNKNQSQIFKDHMANGGRKASYLIPVIVSTVISAALLAMIFYSNNIPDQKLTLDGNELYYTENVEKDDAAKLAAYLSEQGFFSESQEVSVKIDKKSDIYKFSLIIDQDNLDYIELEQYAKEISEALSKHVFGNNQVDVILCNKFFKPLKTIPGRNGGITKTSAALALLKSMSMEITVCQA